MNDIPIIKNEFLFVTFLSTVFIIASIANRDAVYINYGFATFLYSFVAYFINAFFVKSGFVAFDKNNRKVEFTIQLALLLVWLCVLSIL